jgi:Protein of unknown function (DUF2934)
MTQRQFSVPTSEKTVGCAQAPPARAERGDLPPEAEHGDLPPEEVQRRIAETAYFLAATRDFADGDPVQDWLEAEIMVHATIAEDRNP